MLATLASTLELIFRLKNDSDFGVKIEYLSLMANID